MLRFVHLFLPATDFMDKRTLIFLVATAVTFFGVNYYFSETTKAVAPPKPKEQKVHPVSETGSYYVLENGYQQLVFSDKGAALAEVNLPFNTPESVVKPIEFDTEMAKDSPFNAQFPSQKYLKNGSPDLKDPVLGGYYPLLRRTLVLDKQNHKVTIPPRFFLGNTVSEYPEIANLTYKVKEFDQNHIVFENDQPLRKIRKTYSFATAGGKVLPYVIDLKIEVIGESKGLYLTSGVPEIELVSGSPAPVLKYRLVRQDKTEIEKIDMPKEREEISFSSIYPNWVSNSNGYFGVIINPVSDVAPGYKVEYAPGSVVPTRLIDIDSRYDRYKASDYPGYMTLMPLSNSEAASFYRIFAGPYEDSLLKSIDAQIADTGIENPDFAASQTFLGWFSFISRPFAKLLMILLNFFYEFTNSWAFSIVLLTIVLRVMLYPLNNWSFKSMRRMQALSPKMTAIQERYKKEPKKAQMEIMNLYRQEKVNPVSGCLPLLIQMPFLIGMFDLLKSAFPLRGASFIPGWIDNLTAPDVLFTWGYPLPLIGNQLHLLPFLLGAVMFLQQKMSSTAPKDVSQMTDQQRQQKLMGNIMVAVFTIMFYNFPSGLNIYWFSSMLLGVLQQWLTNKMAMAPKKV